jgi:hypothetical protein
MNTSDPVLLCIENAMRWVICPTRRRRFLGRQTGGALAFDGSLVRQHGLRRVKTRPNGRRAKLL